MQGVSRASLAAVREKLDATLDGGSKEAAADAQQVAEELFAIVALLDGNARLRRLLSDPAVDADRRKGLAEDLFADRLSAPSFEVVKSLVGSSWGKPPDLVDAADEIAAQALFAMAEQANVLDEVEDELFRFGRILDREPTLRSALTDPSLPVDRKTDLIQALLGDRVQNATLVLVREVVLHPRGRTIDRGLEDYGRLAAARRERLIARVRIAAPLTSKQLEQLGASLESRLGHPVQLNVELAPDLIGGLTVRVGDVLFDGSITHRISLARRVMTG